MTAPAAARGDATSIRLLYAPQDPTLKQHAFLLLDDVLPSPSEAFYGGAGGGGKSSALLMAAARYVDVPGYSALLLRRTYADLALPGALMARALEWWSGTDAAWSATDFRWTFPSGATITFGYLQTSRDKYRYASAEFQFIGFDELTQFPKDDYRFLFTRLRGPSAGPLSRVPLRVRSAANPGGIGHEWVRDRFILRRPDKDDPEDTPERARRRIFIPADLADNPHVDAAGYRASLTNADPVTRARILAGDWSVTDAALFYDPEGIDAAELLGADLDVELADGTIAPPAGGALATGWDFGEHTHYLIIWPLERGGLYITAGDELVSSEPGDSAAAALVDLERTVTAARQPPRPGAHAPLPAAGHPLDLVSDHRFDAAGIQSMRTVAKVYRRKAPRTRTTSIPFAQYKRETMGYLRRLFWRTAAGDNLDAYVARKWGHHGPERVALMRESLAGAGIIAISPRAGELLRQLRKLELKDVDTGTVIKGDDHGPDALIAAAAPIARRHRG